ncbi:MAG: hypothetical protein P1P71_08180, partial [Anaerosomatales bacterium]|nr:hypothetical protein [Anaerosomatales bacterium]
RSPWKSTVAAFTLWSCSEMLVSISSPRDNVLPDRCQVSVAYPASISSSTTARIATTEGRFLAFMRFIRAPSTRSGCGARGPRNSHSEQPQARDGRH